MGTATFGTVLYEGPLSEVALYSLLVHACLGAQHSLPEEKKAEALINKKIMVSVGTPKMERAIDQHSFVATPI